MSTLTSFLALLKKSPTTDGADVFNLDTILNDNWDKLDAAVGARYGVCGSAAATAAKTVTISGFVLLAGVPFTVKFTNGNSAAALTLNVSSTGAKSVKCRGGATLTAAMIPAGHVASLCYDGAAFWLLNPADWQEKLTATGVLKGTGDAVDGGADDADLELSAETKALLGLAGDSMLSAALALLGRLNSGLGDEYVWEKSVPNWVIPLGAAFSLTIYHPTYSAYSVIYFSDEYEYDISSHTVTLIAPQSITVNPNVQDQSYLNILRGKYVLGSPAAGQNWAISSTNGSPSMYKIDDNCVFTRSSSSPYLINASSDGAYRMPYMNGVIDERVIHGYVNAPSSDAYPPDVPDGYTYTLLGQLGNKLRLAAGKYVGTGTYGSTNKTSITFDFAPKIIFLYADSSNASGNSLYNPLIIFPGKNIYIKIGASSGEYTCYCTTDGATVQFYNSVSALRQYNETNTQYYYIALD